MAKFPERLKELRNEKNLSQQLLADKLGTSKSSINMYERGEREPGLEMMEAIADFFNVDMDYLHGKSDIRCKYDVFSASDHPVIRQADDELQQYLEELKNRPEMRMLFKLSSKCTKEEVEQTVRIIEALRGKE